MHRLLHCRLAGMEARWSAQVASQRNVSGGVGRGDLNTMNPMSTTLNRRKGGVFRGLTHSSQSTDVQSGQLHVRKRILHATRHGAHSGSGRLRPDVVRWSFLLDSLRRGAEAAVPTQLHNQLLSCASSGLDAETAEALDRAQRWFCTYELQRRLPLLEDSLADAQLRELVRWPGLLRRVWMRLPPTTTPTSAKPDHTSCVSDSKEAAATDKRTLITTSPSPHPVAAQMNSASAVSLQRLNDAVYAIVERELMVHAGSPATAGPRERAAWARLVQTWKQDSAWHLGDGCHTGP